MSIPSIVAGIPAANFTLYHRIRFSVGDPAALLEVDDGRGGTRRVLIIRDIEMDRARRSARADEVHCPRDFEPAGGLSGDRETATAQAAAECLRRHGATRVTADRTLALSFVSALREAAIEVDYDAAMGVEERRHKDEQEIEWLREAQRITEKAMEMACGMIADADADSDGGLRVDGAPLTSERVREALDVFLLREGYVNPTSIVAGGPAGADCHESGKGPLRTGAPVIVDVFPRNRATLYNGDCTRTVVHGAVPDAVAAMHRAVVDAKAAATAATRAGVTGADVHNATATAIRAAGYAMGMPADGSDSSWCGMPHGTGHGIGLEVHEPPLLDAGGPTLVVGDALTIEPGLYSPSIGGIRVEDMVIVTADGCLNLNALHEGLDWRR